MMEQKNPAWVSGAWAQSKQLLQNYHNAPTADVQALFLDAMRDAGITPPNPAEIVGDGALHRFHIDGDKRGTRNGWAVLHLDGVPSGAFGSWKAGFSKTWCAKSRDSLTPKELAEHHRRVEAAREAAIVLTAQKHAEAASKAAYLWSRAKPAPENHPYLARKAVKPFDARTYGDALVLPIATIRGALVGLQFIEPDGSKRLMSGTPKKGNLVPVHTPESNRIIICEGWATGATIAQADPSAMVLAAIDAGNLEPVALAVRRKWRDADLVIACDNDRATPGNPGLTKGRAAALATGAKIMVPEFPADAPLHLSDFNDRAAWMAGRAA